MSYPVCSYSCNSSNNKVTPKCDHNMSMKMFVTNSAANPGRKYWKCKFWGREDDCNLFHWDDELCGEREANVMDREVVYVMRKMEKDLTKKMEDLKKQLDDLRKKLKFLIDVLVAMYFFFMIHVTHMVQS
ncbi:uncharacterized protein LOC131649939 [Vicia villosa]|uniref:uncharacterized protein LOC131649939 n=1 Tax=Vicia villosa TaxID=3911 RepID=UPI00273CDA12|nr:uncharacterized protein LOC131649939 [Vicia villosa]